jgi:predicted dehydrogenase
MSSTVKLGLVGCGVIGQVHLRVAQAIDGAAFTAVCDVREDVARETATQHTIARVYADAEALFADADVDAVVLALPANLRTALGIAAFQHGKHVLTEKPVAMNAGEVRQLIAARGDRIAGCTSSRLRFLPSAKAITDFIATGALGDLRVVRCRDVVAAGAPPTKPPPVWRLNKALNAGGILVNWGCYDLDYLFGITGWALQPRRVIAQTWPNVPAYAAYAAAGSDAETHVAFFAQCENNIALTYERGEFMATATDEIWQITGTQGALRMNMKPAQGKQVWFDKTTPHGTVSEVIWQGDEDWETQHRGPLEDFVQAVRDHREPATSLEKALRIQALTDAVYRSSDAGVCVELDQ